MTSLSVKMSQIYRIAESVQPRGAKKNPATRQIAQQGHHNQAQLARLEQTEQGKYDMSQVARQARHAGGNAPPPEISLFSVGHSAFRNKWPGVSTRARRR